MAEGELRRYSLGMATKTVAAPKRAALPPNVEEAKTKYETELAAVNTLRSEMMDSLAKFQSATFKMIKARSTYVVRARKAGIEVPTLRGGNGVLDNDRGRRSIMAQIDIFCAKCWSVNKAEIDQPPQSGDVMLCVFCASPLMVNENLAWHPMTREQLDVLPQDKKDGLTAFYYNYQFIDKKYGPPFPDDDPDMPPPAQRKKDFDKQVKGCTSFVHNGDRTYVIARLGPKAFANAPDLEVAHNARKMMEVLGYKDDGQTYHFLGSWDEIAEQAMYQVVTDDVYQQMIHDAGMSEVSPN